MNWQGLHMKFSISRSLNCHYTPSKPSLSRQVDSRRYRNISLSRIQPMLHKILDTNQTPGIFDETHCATQTSSDSTFVEQNVKRNLLILGSKKLTAMHKSLKPSPSQDPLTKIPPVRKIQWSQLTKTSTRNGLQTPTLPKATLKPQ